MVCFNSLIVSVTSISNDWLISADTFALVLFITRTPYTGNHDAPVASIWLLFAICLVFVCNLLFVCGCFVTKSDRTLCPMGPTNLVCSFGLFDVT